MTSFSRIIKDKRLFGLLTLLTALNASLVRADDLKSPFRTKEMSIGLDPSPANNVKLHRGASGLQAVPASDATADGVDSGAATKFVLGTLSVTDFIPTGISAGSITIASGSVILADGRELVLASNATFNLKTQVLTSGITAPSATTQYYLYVDLFSLAASTTDSTTGRQRILLTSGTGGNFIVLAQNPEAADKNHYLPVAALMTDGSSNYTSAGFSKVPPRFHQGPTATVSTTFFTQNKTVVGSPGSSGQIAAGHILTSASFPSFTTQTSFYNLANTSDGSGNARTLTNNGSTPFTGTNLFGTASATASFNGTNQSLSSTSSFFNPGNGTNIAMGGWFNATNWTPAAESCLVTQQQSATDQGFAICVETTGQIRFFGTNSATSKDLDLFYPAPGFTNGTWHHFAWVYNFSTSTLKGYIDGVMVVSGFLANQRAVTSPLFQIAAIHASGIDWFAGQAEEVFFTTSALTDNDIHRLYSYRVDHNTNIPVENQEWTATFWDPNENIITEFNRDWIVSKNANSVFIDLGISSTSKAALRLHNESFTTGVIPIRTYSSGPLSAAPSFPVSHGLSCVPKDFYVLTQGQSLSTQWDKRYDLCSATSTTITCDLSSLTIDGSHQVEVVASCAPIAISVPPADATNSGLVSATTQTFGGAKTFAASPTFSLGLTSSGTSTFNSGLTSNGTTNFNSGFTASTGTITGLATLTGGYSAGAASSVTGQMTVTGRGLFNYPTENSGQIWTNQQFTFAAGTGALTIPGWGFVIVQNCNSGEIATFLVSSAGTFLVSQSSGWAAGTGAGTNNKLSFNSGTGVITITNNNGGARTYTLFAIGLQN